MPFFQPNNISGIFLWYKSTGDANNSNLNLSDNAQITYWADLSGSGNNLTLFNSGTFPAPYYKASVFNGYPSIRFSGQETYLASTNNASVNLAISGLTLFTLFYSVDPTGQQTIIADEGHAGVVVNSMQWLVGLNYNNMPSSWYYTWFEDAGNHPPALTIAASSYHEGFTLSMNTPTLRMDGFDLTNGNFAFQKFGAECATGIGSMQAQSTTNNIKVGGNYNIGQGGWFNGDLYEIIGYNRILSSGEIQQVSNYIFQKYQTVNTSGISLYLSATAHSSTVANFPLYVGSSQVSNSSIPLYMYGRSTASGNFPLFIWGRSSGNQSFPLFLDSSNKITGSFPLFLNSASVINTNCLIDPVYFDNDFFGLRYFNYNYFSPDATQISYRTCGVPLYIFATAGSSYTKFPLYIGSSLRSSSGVPLYTTGAFKITSNFPLYMKGGFENKNFPLYIHGKLSVSGGFPLFVNAASGNNSNFPLFMHGITVIPPSSALHNMFLPLYIFNTPPARVNNNFSLVITAPQHANASSIYKDFPLYMKVSGPGASMPLYLGVNKEPFPSSFMPLYIAGPITTGTTKASFPIYVCNNVSGIVKPLLKMFVQGLGVMDGASIQVGAMNLFLNRPGSNLFPLYIYGRSTSNSGITLYASGAHEVSGGINLYTGGVGASGYIPLFVQGQVPTTGVVPLYLYGRELEEESLTLYTHGF